MGCIMSLYKQLTQVCKLCFVEKDISLFEWNKNRPSPRTTCKACRYIKRNINKENKQAKERKKIWFEANKEIIRQKAELRLYGITKEQLGQTCCQICGGFQRLSIDHDHVTGKVRGLLCSPCNIGLGGFKDNPESLLKAVEYLKNT